jgi:hypothetical protein
MPNLYGVANCPTAPQGQGLSGNTACPAGAETNVITSTPIIAPSNGYFFPYAFGQVGIQCGATPPSACNISLRIGNGADIGSFGIVQNLLVANAVVTFAITLFGGPSQSPWTGAGSVLNISVTPVGQAVTALQSGGACYFGLFRAPDQ